MAYIHELRADHPVVVVNPDGVTRVVSPEGAVFTNLLCDDVESMAVASANLFQDNWRPASREEINSWYTRINKLPVSPRIAAGYRIEA